ncbi:acyltransferase family protein [Nocardioides sp. R-C-SC26]|uniref:acyltransferase family protein n=1 Tax=Nocardioides sp. R-C-SC26 TaxID=2870414 RepID=UPI001E2CB940|nr:acyltransferase family protein [Nocardioides sp. R-C-SC26]
MTISEPIDEPSGASAARPRLAWPDVAKGACILLVVLHHVVTKEFTALVSEPLAPVGDVWSSITWLLKPVRMPLFFVVSGFFMATALRRPWPWARARMQSGYYLYVVWLTVMIGVYAWETRLPANRIESPADFVGELLWAASSLWFLYALVLYHLLARLTARFDPRVVVAVAAGVSMAVSALPLDETNRVAVLANAVFYLAGALFPHLVSRIAAMRPALGRLLVTYLAVAAMATMGPLPRSVGMFLASCVGIPLGIALAVRAADTDLGRGLAWLGRRTLRVYVLHLIVLAAFVQIPHQLWVGHRWSPWVALAYPVALTVLIVLACFGLHHLLQRIGAGFLFTAPAWTTRTWTPTRRTTAPLLTSRDTTWPSRSVRDDGPDRRLR